MIEFKNIALVAGGREFSNKQYLFETLDHVQNGFRKARRPIDLLIHGNALGADRLAGEWARRRGVPVVLCPYWSHMGRRGGYERNRFMAQFFEPDVGVLFPGNRGTAHMKSILVELDIPHIEAWEIWFGDLL